MTSGPADHPSPPADGPRTGEGPIFVVGASRSGTAVIRSALNRSPDIFLAGETHYFDDLRPRLGDGATGPLDDAGHRSCQDYFLALSHRPYGHGGRHESARLDRDELSRLARTLGGTGDAYFEAYCRLARTLEPDAATSPSRWGEKTPRHVFRIPDILARYPDAQVVAMYRDPRAVVSSYGNWRHQGGLAVGDDAGYAEALASEEDRARASYDPSVISLLWRATLRAGRSAQSRFGARTVRLVRYEDLVSDPAATLAGVMTWLGLEFDPAMLDVPMHNSSFSTFRRGAGLSTEAVERWRSTLSPHEVALVQFWCRSGLQSLGYPVEEAGMSGVARARVLASLPMAAGRAVWVNRERAGSLPSYVWRRARLMRTH